MTKSRSFTGTEARRLLRRARTATLATLNRDGGLPYASLANAATDVDGRPIILISELAWHTQNLRADSRASLLVAEPAQVGDALTGSRATVMGHFRPSDEPRLKRRYLARHPQAAGYAEFPDFGFWLLEPELIHAIAGFGRIETLPSDEVFPPVAEMAAIETGAIEHMNADHRDAIQSYATRLLGAPAGNWRIAAIDPDGADLMNDEQCRRLEFPEPVFDAAGLRRCLKQLSERVNR